MIFLGTVVLAMCALVSRVDCVDWCYHLSSCSSTTWPNIVPVHCNGSRQSPIDINTTAAKFDPGLKALSFTKFTINTSLSYVENTGKTVRVVLNDGVKISGNNLSHVYDVLELHLHWGNKSSVPGSDHTVNGKRYPMELQILSLKDIYGRNKTKAAGDSTGFVALGFFIEEMSGSETGKPESWKNLTDYLSNIKTQGQRFSIPSGISLDSLIEGVNLTRYYRYLGSFTTPTCDETVVWTVYKEPVKVSKDLIDLFSTTVHIDTLSSPLMTNNYRVTQADLDVRESSASSTCYSLGLMVLSLALWS